MTESIRAPIKCRVTGAEKALAEAGGPDALCELITRAAKAQAPGLSFEVEVRALSTHSLSAKIRLPDGRVRPDLNISVSDRRIDRGSLESFATAIVQAAVGAGRG